MAVYCFGFWLILLSSHCLAIDESFKNNIKEIRTQVLKKAEEDSSLFHPNDVKYLKDDDWPILRFLLETQNDKEKAQERVIKAFNWRNKELQPMDYFPSELQHSRMILFCGQSVAGRTLLQMKATRITLVESLIILSAKLFASNINKIERLTGQKGVDVVVDMSGYDFSYLKPKFIQTTMGWADYFPLEPRNVYLFKFPPAYKSLWDMIKPLLPKHIANNIKFVEDEKQLEEYVKLDQLSKDFGGTKECKTNIPETAESGICQPKFNFICEEDWKKFYKSAKEEFKVEANIGGYKTVADMLMCKNGNSTSNEIIKKLVDS